MKKFLFSLCVALLSCVAFAQTNVVVVLKDGTEVKYSATDIDSIRIEKEAPIPAEETVLKFEYDDSTMTATVYGVKNREPKEVKIPSQVLYDGKVYDVNTIGGGAFIGCENLTSIEIPNSVTEIDTIAFEGCTSLTSIEIPNSVTQIGGMAFAYCTSLTSIEIPNSVTEIGIDAFDGCSSLTNIVVDKDNKVYDSRENCNAIIETASNTLIAGCQNTVIPNSVTYIGDRAFDRCTGLTSIVIPNSVTEIGEWAFAGCESLTSIEIPNSVTAIGWGAFYGCTSLTSIEIPESVTEIGAWAFEGCTSLKTARVPVSLKGEIPSNAFPSTCEIEWYDPLTGETVIPAEETVLKFEYDDSTMTATVYGVKNREAKEVKIPSQVLYDGNVYDVTSIGEYAFNVCTSLTSIVIPNSVTEIGEYAFNVCTSLTSIEIPNSVTKIGSWAFYECTSLTSIEIPNSVTSIGEYAFNVCTSLTSIEIPNSVTEIGNYAFDGCINLKTARVPKGCEISEDAFPSTCEIEYY